MRRRSRQQRFSLTPQPTLAARCCREGKSCCRRTGRYSVPASKGQKLEYPTGSQNKPCNGGLNPQRISVREKSSTLAAATRQRWHERSTVRRTDTSYRYWYSGSIGLTDDRLGDGYARACAAGCPGAGMRNAGGTKSRQLRRVHSQHVPVRILKRDIFGGWRG